MKLWIHSAATEDPHMAESPETQANAGIYVYPNKDRPNVLLDRHLVDREVVGDPLIRTTFNEVMEDLPLAG